jgi:hypothetical protein
VPDEPGISSTGDAAVRHERHEGVPQLPRSPGVGVDPGRTSDGDTEGCRVARDYPNPPPPPVGGPPKFVGPPKFIAGPRRLRRRLPQPRQTGASASCGGSQACHLTRHCHCLLMPSTLLPAATTKRTCPRRPARQTACHPSSADPHLGGRRRTETAGQRQDAPPPTVIYTEEVTGSIPVSPTIKAPGQSPAPSPRRGASCCSGAAAPPSCPPMPVVSLAKRRFIAVAPDWMTGRSCLR